MLPQIPAAYLPRAFLQRLTDCLTNISPVRLLLFSAPAGYGKTTALIALGKTYLEQTGRCLVWLTLSDEDNDSITFFRRLTEALHEVNSAIGNDVLGYFRQNLSKVPASLVADSLLNDLQVSRQPVLIVLDDLHLITCPDIFTALERFLNYASQGVKVAIGTRSQPAFSIATLRAKAMMVEVGLQDLQLTPDEMKAYFANRGMTVNEPLFDELYLKTEGWVAGVHLAYLWLQQNQQGVDDSGLFSKKGREGFGRYLLNTVFGHLPDDVQQNLLMLSGATQLNASLAETLTGCSDGQTLLESLEKARLFLLPMDRDRQWFRFHALFADFLHDCLTKQQPEGLRQQYCKACFWFAGQQMPFLAVEHACLAKEPELLGRLLNRYGLDMINSGQLMQIRRWLPLLSDEVIRKFPILMLIDVWFKALDTNVSEPKQVVDELTEAWINSTVSLSGGEEIYFVAMLIKAVLALQKDDLEQCIGIVESARPHLGKGVPFLEAALLLAGAFAMAIKGCPENARHLLLQAQQRNHFLKGHYLSTQLLNIEIILALEQGAVKQAQLLIDKLHDRSQLLSEESTAVFVFPVITESLVAYQQMQLDGLEERLRCALAHIDVISPIDLYAQGILCAARLQFMKGCPREAKATLSLMKAVALQHQSGRFYALAIAEEINLILHEASPDKVKRAEQRLAGIDQAKMGRQYQTLQINPIYWVYGLSRIRILQAKGHYSEALHEINRLRGQLQPGWHGLRHLRLDILASISYQQLGYLDRAHHIMGEALAMAEREQIKSLFFEEGKNVLELLKDMTSTERQPALTQFIRNLLQIWPGQQAGTVDIEFDEELTERERDVICLAAKGFSNEEISRRLELALGTVKWHLHNIYQKLKVRNRTRAIRQARELNLI